MKVERIRSENAITRWCGKLTVGGSELCGRMESPRARGASYASAAVGFLAIPANLVPLIKRTFLYTYMLATRMRNDMIDDGQSEELETLVKEAYELQNSLRSGVSE